MSMLFTINNSPFFGKEGKFCTSRHIGDRLYKELEKNLALRVETKEGTTDQWIVSGRGVLHLSVLIETMRREGYELQVGQPQVIYKEINGVRCEPVEELTINVPEEFASKMIDMVTRRKGEMVSMEAQGDRVNIEFEIPSRGIIGLRTNVLTASQGEAIMAHRFKDYQPFKGELTRRTNGSLIALESGTAYAYAIDHLQDRGKFFINPQDTVYAGQVVGEHVHEIDLVINVTKAKQLTNVRASGTDEKAHIIPPVVLSLEAPDDKSFAELVMAHRESILEAFNANEFKRERAFLKKKHSGVVSRQVQKQFGVDIQAPVDVDDIKKGKDFMWASASEQEFRLNVCVYTLPLREMTAEKLVEARDSVMKINIPGGREGQWMETDRRSVLSGSVTVDGKDLMAVRGFWDMKDDAMGGPFVCYVYPDEKRQRLLIAEGFVFAPNTKKRPLIRQLEATLQTINLQP